MIHDNEMDFRTTVNYKLSLMNFRYLRPDRMPSPGEKTGKHLRCPFKHVCANYVVTYEARIGGNINSINAPLASHPLRKNNHPLFSLTSTATLSCAISVARFVVDFTSVKAIVMASCLVFRRSICRECYVSQ